MNTNKTEITLNEITELQNDFATSTIRFTVGNAYFFHGTYYTVIAN